MTGNADILAGFSSRGPTPFTYLIKPDVTAPGVNVLSSVFDQEFAFFQGTSMATPHLAGSAALLLDLNPDWSPADVKSALVNTAARVVTDSNTGTVDPGVLARGGGRVDLTAVADIPVTIDPASASFGLWKGNKPVSASLDLTLFDVSDGATCTVAVTGPDIVTASADQVSVPDDGNATLTLILDAGRSDTTPSGDYSGDVDLNCDGTTLLVPWWVRIDR
jgi:minor extracellular serine protease Vpr